LAGGRGRRANIRRRGEDLETPLPPSKGRRKRGEFVKKLGKSPLRARKGRERKWHVWLELRSFTSVRKQKQRGAGEDFPKEGGRSLNGDIFSKQQAGRSLEGGKGN